MSNSIYTKTELKEWLKYEKGRYFPEKPYNGNYQLDAFLGETYLNIWKFQKLLRKTEYHYNNRKNIFHRIAAYICNRKKNAYGARIGIEIPKFTCGKGLLIDHCAGIVINGNVRIGENCRLHGNNCIGNKGEGRTDEYPVIGDNVDLGFGAVVIGKLTVANNVKVGANAVVTKSIEEEGSVYAGAPARRIK